VGVALLLILIAPGLAYVLRREKSVPTGPRTAFREALQVIFVSVASLTSIGLLAALVRVFAPDHTPNVRGLIRAPGPFFRDHYVQLVWWSLGLLAAATLLAWLMADPRVVRNLQDFSRWHRITWLTGASEADITEVSAWWRIFEELKPAGTGLTSVGVLKDDGSYIQGSLVSYSSGGLDNDKRELILTAPLVYVTGDGVQRPLEAQMVLIAGRNISRLDVTHLPVEAAPGPHETTAPAEPAKAMSSSAGQPPTMLSAAPDPTKSPTPAEAKAPPPTS
jgi:hypothetical protein